MMIMAGDHERAVSRPGPENEEREKTDEGEVVGVRVQAMDEVVSINSFLTGAVFIAEQRRQPGGQGPGDPCYVTPHLLCQLLLLEVLAFSCFLMSCLPAQGLKVHLTLCRLCSGKAAAAAIADSSATGPADAKADTWATAGGPRRWCPPCGPLLHTTPTILIFCGSGSSPPPSPPSSGPPFSSSPSSSSSSSASALLSCHSVWTKLAATPLVLLVVCGGFIFSSSLFLAFRT